jgi:hypothetical protein
VLQVVTENVPAAAPSAPCSETLGRNAGLVGVICIISTDVCGPALEPCGALVCTLVRVLQANADV